MTRDELEKSGQRCRIRVRIRARGRVHDGYVLHLFGDEMELLTDKVVGIWTGDRVEVVGDGFGPVAGTAQWRVPRRLGVKFGDMMDSEAGLRDLWRFSPRPERAPR